MNANELADKQAFETGELTMWIRNETATMLRQQQAEINALKKEAALQRLSDFTQEAEIEALKAKLHKYHLKEDLDRNLNLIYGKELLK
jgi:hypothetical protein